MSNTLQAGLAAAVITPPVGASLSGYATRPGSAAGVHDDLFCKAIVFSNGQTKAALVSLDLLGLSSDQVGKIRNACGEWLDIPGSNVFVACSHTHAGPAIQLLRFCGTPDDEYVSWLLDTVVETIEKAKLDLAPCHIRTAATTSDLAMNRRYKAPSGEVQLADNEGGFCDPEVRLVQITREGKRGAVLYNYACHGVVLGCENIEVSADWIGAASRTIEQSTGSAAMFLQGCCGNINPRLRGSFEAVEAAGKLVGSAVAAALGKASGPGEESAEISVSSLSVELPFQPLPSSEELARFNAEMQQQIAAARAEGKPEHMLDWPKGLEEWSRVAMERVETGHIEKSIPIELSVLRIGSFRIFAIPGEVFAEYGHNIKSLAPDILVAAYANGNIGYVPTAQAYEEGGYEVDSAYKLYGVQMIGPQSEQIILSAAKELLGK